MDYAAHDDQQRLLLHGTAVDCAAKKLAYQQSATENNFSIPKLYNSNLVIKSFLSRTDILFFLSTILFNEMEIFDIDAIVSSIF